VFRVCPSAQACPLRAAPPPARVELPTGRTTLAGGGAVWWPLVRGRVDPGACPGRPGSRGGAPWPPEAGRWRGGGAGGVGAVPGAGSRAGCRPTAGVPDTAALCAAGFGRPPARNVGYGLVVRADPADGTGALRGPKGRALIPMRRSRQLSRSCWLALGVAVVANRPRARARE